MHATPALIATLMRQLEQQEGRINHMYRDTRGFITVGVGHLLPHPQAATRQAFIHRDSQQPASDAEIRAEFRHLLTLNYGQHHSAAGFRHHTRLELPDEQIDRLTRQHINHFSQELADLYGADALAAMPEPVQLALYDMIFNLGLPKLKHGFPRFNHHIRNRNWAAAADESHRRGISESRNRHVHDLLSGKLHQQVATQPTT
jgi:GH24 family phage-related lysozyme (muramidase)